MAVNPRGANSSQGSRYFSERLVGPGVIAQNSYIDRAKAMLHIGNVVPVPQTTITTNALGNTVIPTGFRAGDVVRIGSTSTTIADIQFLGTDAAVNDTAIGGSIHLVPNSYVILVIPFVENSDGDIIEAISFNHSNDPLFYEFIRDN